MTTLRKVALGALGLPLVTFGIITAIWLGGRPAAGEAANGITVGGRDVSGSTRAEVADAVAALADDFADTPVVISTPDFEVETTAGELGVSIDEGASVAAVLRVGHHDAGPWAPLRFASRWFAANDVAPHLASDPVRAAATLAKLEGANRVEVTEPGIDATGDEITLVPGRSGKSLDTADILGRLPRRAPRRGTPIRIEARQTVTAPEVSDREVAALVERANRTTATTLKVTVADRTTEVDGALFRPGFSLATDEVGAHLVVDPQLVASVLSEQSGISSANPTGVRFTLTDGVPTPVPGLDAPSCCGDAAPRQLADALLAGRTEVTLEARTVTAADGVRWAAGLGVKEVIGEFTTKHPCCAPRVRNIHRISDLTRGVVIAPGETFSVNGFVGRRTTEKGFVTAPVIEQGEFKEDVGGGVSQFATTLFNAAFFGGLDIPEHKAHSIYISRYPFGREATLAYPSVDLKITNNTPHGVMIWPTYTDTSITVQLWSTRYAVGAQTAINRTGGCGFVKVTRTRLFVTDASSETDEFTASYDCDPPEH